MKGAKNGLEVIQSDKRILYLGLSQSLFEGAMYSFVFLWTPAMTFGLEKTDLPFGLIFASFMAAVMGGSIGFTRILQEKPIEQVPLYIHGSSTVLSLCTAILTGNQYLTFLTFVGFECVCGCFFPTYKRSRVAVDITLQSHHNTRLRAYFCITMGERANGFMMPSGYIFRDENTSYAYLIMK